MMTGSSREDTSVTPDEIESARLGSAAADPAVEQTETIPAESGLPESESINVWPDEAAEPAFPAKARGASEETIKREAPVREEVLAPLPKLDELIKRIPAESRELLEELFRAKFTTVRRVKQSDLKV
jgi:hypothetical protein